MIYFKKYFISLKTNYIYGLITIKKIDRLQGSIAFEFTKEDGKTFMFDPLSEKLSPVTWEVSNELKNAQEAYEEENIDLSLIAYLKFSSSEATQYIVDEALETEFQNLFNESLQQMLNDDSSNKNEIESMLYQMQIEATNKNPYGRAKLELRKIFDNSKELQEKYNNNFDKYKSDALLVLEHQIIECYKHLLKNKPGYKETFKTFGEGVYMNAEYSDPITGDGLRSYLKKEYNFESEKLDYSKPLLPQAQKIIMIVSCKYQVGNAVSNALAMLMLEEIFNNSPELQQQYKSEESIELYKEDGLKALQNQIKKCWYESPTLKEQYKNVYSTFARDVLIEALEKNQYSDPVYGEGLSSCLQQYNNQGLNTNGVSLQVGATKENNPGDFFGTVESLLQNQSTSSRLSPQSHEQGSHASHASSLNKLNQQGNGRF